MSETSEALAALRAVLEEDLITRPQPGSVTLTEWTRLAALAPSAGDAALPDAASTLDAYLERFPASAKALFLRALVAPAQHQNPGPWFEKLAATGGKKLAGLLFLARELSTRGDFQAPLQLLADHPDAPAEERLAALRRLSRLDPDDAALLHRIADALGALDRRDEAVKTWKILFHRAAERREHDDLAEAWKALVRLQPGETPFFVEQSRRLASWYGAPALRRLLDPLLHAADRRGDGAGPEVLALFSEALRLTPEDMVLRQDLADLLRKRHGDRPFFEAALGWSGLFKNQKEGSQALDLLGRALRLGPGDAVRHPEAGLGVVREVRFQTRKGEEAFHASTVAVDFGGAEREMTLGVAETDLTPVSKEEWDYVARFDAEAAAAWLADGSRRGDLARSVWKAAATGDGAALKDLKNALLAPLAGGTLEKDGAAAWTDLAALYDGDPGFEKRAGRYFAVKKKEGQRDLLVEQIGRTTALGEKLALWESLIRQHGREEGSAALVAAVVGEEARAGGKRGLAFTARLALLAKETGLDFGVDAAALLAAMTSDAGFPDAWSDLESKERTAVLELLPDALGPDFFEGLFWTRGADGKGLVLERVLKIAKKKKDADFPRGFGERAATKVGAHPELFALVAKRALTKDDVGLTREQVALHLAEIVKLASQRTGNAPLAKSTAAASRQAAKHLFEENLLEDTAAAAAAETRARLYAALENAFQLSEAHRIRFRETMTRHRAR